jgi:predicted nucleotidyltransferase
MVLTGDPAQRAGTVAEAVGGAMQQLSPAGRVVAVYVHGSVLLDRFHPRSDVDLAVLFASGAPWDQRLEVLSQIETAVATAIGRTVDVQEVPPDTYSVFGDIVKRSGTAVWIGDQEVHDAWCAMIDRSRPERYTPAGVRVALREAVRAHRAL